MTISAATTRWPLVLMLAGAGVVVAFQIGKAPAALPALRAELGMSLVAASWVISIFNVVGLLSGMVLGALAERFGHRRAALGGLALVAAASAAGALAPSGAVLLASRFIEGLGFMIVVVATPALIVRATPARDLKLAFGFWGAYMPAGTAVMMAAAPLLIASVGWRGLWLANAILVATFALALAAATRALAPLPGPARDLAGDVAATLRHRGPLLLGLTFATYTGHFLVVFGFLPTLLIETEGLDALPASLLGAIAVFANVPGNLLGGWLLHRGARRWALIVAASAIMAVCSTLFFAVPLPFIVRYALVIAISFFGGMVPTSILGLAPALAPSPGQVAVATGLVMQGSNLGQSLGPPAVAALATWHGAWTLSPLILAASAATGIVLALRIRPLEDALARR
jgi:MFS family permease